MNKCHAGDAVLLEYGALLIEHNYGKLSIDSRNQVKSLLGDYLKQKSSYEQIYPAFVSICGNTDVLDKIRSVITLGDDPLIFTNDEEDGLANGRRKMRNWTIAEDNRLLAGIYRYGIDNWAPISKFVGNKRSRAQCAQRWTRGLNPRICKDVWDSSEDMLLVQLVQQFGDKAWTKVASYLGNRSDVQCRYHYHQIMKDYPNMLITPSTLRAPLILQPIRTIPLYQPRYSVPSLIINPIPQSQENSDNKEIQCHKSLSTLPILRRYSMSEDSIKRDPSDGSISETILPAPDRALCLDDFLTRFK